MQNQDGAQLVHYPDVFYEEIHEKKCYVADAVKDIFLAKKDVVISGGSWNSERKYYEHEDFFIRLKMAGVKTAYCPDVKFKGNKKRADQFLRKMWEDDYAYYNKLLSQSWNISHHLTCNDVSYYLSSDYCENPHVDLWF